MMWRLTALRTAAFPLISSLCLLVSTQQVAAQSDRRKPPSASTEGLSEKSLYQSDSVWVTDRGIKTNLRTFRGKPQIVAMFFSSCQFSCPILVNQMKDIESALSERARRRVGFVLISFDSERDTPEKLRAFRRQHALSDKNWTLIRGEPEAVQEMAALLGVNYRKDSNGQFAHSNMITLLNKEGEIVFQKQGLTGLQDDVVKAVLPLVD